MITDPARDENLTCRAQSFDTKIVRSYYPTFAILFLDFWHLVF
jgi:hypothetical protein